jgi:predicted DCC family thiol-disulfide oxidoreductase YuxK
MDEHIIFFDGECPFCHRAVRHIVGIDAGRHFRFAPLGGSTAREILIGPQEPLTRAQSLVLAENYQSTGRHFYTRSRAIFRIYWIVGGKWSFLGLLSFLPCWLGDVIYRWFAAHRHQFRLPMDRNPGPNDRFLP